MTTDALMIFERDQLETPRNGRRPVVVQCYLRYLPFAIIALLCHLVSHLYTNLHVGRLAACSMQASSPPREACFMAKGLVRVGALHVYFNCRHHP